MDILKEDCIPLNLTSPSFVVNCPVNAVCGALSETRMFIMFMNDINGIINYMSFKSPLGDTK